MFFKRKWISIGIIFAAILLLAIPVIAVNRAYPRAEQVEISVGESFDWKGISVRVNGMRTGTDTDRGTLSEEEQEQLRGIGLPTEGWYYAVVDLTFANETEESKSGLWWNVHLQSEVFSNGCMGFLGGGSSGGDGGGRCPGANGTIFDAGERCRRHQMEADSRAVSAISLCSPGKAGKRMKMRGQKNIEQNISRKW